MNYTEKQVQVLIDAARMAEAELVTLAPRLGQPYQSHVREAADALTSALKSFSAGTGYHEYRNPK